MTSSLIQSWSTLTLIDGIMQVREGDVTFLGDEIRKRISILIEVCITSLNSHYWL